MNYSTYTPYYFAPWSPVSLTSSYVQGLTVHETAKLPNISKVVYNNPATVVLWSDGTKTVVKRQPGDTYSAETGLAMAIRKKAYGNKNYFNKVFAKWLPHEV